MEEAELRALGTMGFSLMLLYKATDIPKCISLAITVKSASLYHFEPSVKQLLGSVDSRYSLSSVCNSAIINCTMYKVKFSSSIHLMLHLPSSIKCFVSRIVVYHPCHCSPSQKEARNKKKQKRLIMTQYRFPSKNNNHANLLSLSFFFFFFYWEEPPEMVKTCPLTQLPSPLARKATTRATSSGTAQRPRGQWSAMSFSILSAGHSGVPPGM
jgi:hypothetical protein